MNNSKTYRFGRLSVAFFFALILFLIAACKKDNKEPNPCPSVAPQGHLSQAGSGGPCTYRTSGGGTIVIDPDNHILITHDSYPGFRIELWGEDDLAKLCGNHESLNGKHIKDREGFRRSFLFPDGAKVTFAAADTLKRMLSISIYEDAESHRINAGCRTIEHSSLDAGVAQQLDNAEADGEASTIEFIPGGLLWVNIYMEETPGHKVMNRVLLGKLSSANPNQVNDYYDDTRLGNT